MRRVIADLHIHTVLSPCALPEMTPCAIVKRALKQGMDMIGICDHNAVHNVEAIMEAAVRLAGVSTLMVLAGIEITTIEEVHVIGLFPEVDRAAGVGEIVREMLPIIKPENNIMRKALRMDAHDEVSCRETRMLYGATCLDLDETARLIQNNGGLVIPAHVDRPSFSITSQLGMIRRGMPFDALELSAAGFKRGGEKEIAALGYPVVTASDSHSLNEIGSVYTELQMNDITFGELMLALRGQQGRCVEGLGEEEEDSSE